VSRNCGSGVGLSNYKNVFRDDILVGNWQEDLYGNRILPDASNAAPDPDHYLSIAMNDYERPAMDPDRARGGSNIESMPYELLFGHGEELYGDTRNSNADASVSEMHYTKPNFDKRKAHEMLWLGEKANDVTMPAIGGARQDLLQAKKAQWHEEVTKNVHSTSVSRDVFKDPKDQPLMHFKTEPRQARANMLGRTLAAPHVAMGLRK